MAGLGHRFGGRAPITEAALPAALSSAGLVGPPPTGQNGVALASAAAPTTSGPQPRHLPLRPPRATLFFPVFCAAPPGRSTLQGCGIGRLHDAPLWALQATPEARMQSDSTQNLHLPAAATSFCSPQPLRPAPLFRQIKEREGTAFPARSDDVNVPATGHERQSVKGPWLFVGSGAGGAHGFFGLENLWGCSRLVARTLERTDQSLAGAWRAAGMTRGPARRELTWRGPPFSCACAVAARLRA